MNVPDNTQKNKKSFCVKFTVEWLWHILKSFCKLKIKDQLFVRETCSEHFQRNAWFLKALICASLNAFLKWAHSGEFGWRGNKVCALFFPCYKSRTTIMKSERSSGLSSYRNMTSQWKVLCLQQQFKNQRLMKMLRDKSEINVS